MKKENIKYLAIAVISVITLGFIWKKYYSNKPEKLGSPDVEKDENQNVNASGGSYCENKFTEIDNYIAQSNTAWKNGSKPIGGVLIILNDLKDTLVNCSNMTKTKYTLMSLKNINLMLSEAKNQWNSSNSVPFPELRTNLVFSLKEIVSLVNNIPTNNSSKTKMVMLKEANTLINQCVEAINSSNYPSQSIPLGAMLKIMSNCSYILKNK